MAKFKIETIKVGKEGSDYKLITSISDIIADKNEDIIELPSTFEGKEITHLGFNQEYEEAHEVWCDYQHPSKGSDYKEAEYKIGYCYFNSLKGVKKIIVPSTIIQIHNQCFSYCKGLILEFKEDSIYFVKDNCVYKKAYPSLIQIKLK